MKTIFEYLTRKKVKQPVYKTEKKKIKTVTISEEEYKELQRGYSAGTWDGDFMGQ